MEKVILIGGSPMIGKSTISAILASRLLYPCISTDDIGEALQTISNINPMQGKNYLDYYSDISKDELIRDITIYHNVLKPAISRLINIHSTWGNPIVMEGWALYPEHVSSINTNNVFSIWLVASGGLLEKRIHEKSSFYQNASNPESVIENYLYRSEWHNQTILNQCRTLNQNYLLVDNSSKAVDITEQIFTMLGHTV